MGVLADHQLEAALGRAILCERAPEPGQIQPASLDLRLGPVAYRAPASFLAGRGRSVSERVRTLGLSPVSLEEGAVLPRGSIHVVELEERLALPKGVSAIANPKSSTGRLDLFVRLITDGGEAFDRAPAGYEGPLWAEISPRSFHVRARRGSRLLQLRLLDGACAIDASEMRAAHGAHRLVAGAFDLSSDGALGLSLDLGAGLAPEAVVGYEALRGVELAIDLDRPGSCDPREFWRPIRAIDGACGLVLRPGDFYILASAEAVAIPPDLAAEMIAYDSSVGEFRVHYAGFFDPGFGYEPGIGAARTRAVLEVRNHEAPFLLEHGQRVARLAYQRMAARPRALYGADHGSNYHRQRLALAKHFRAWL